MGKKIVFTIDTNTAGGGERVIATLANFMSIKGYDTTIINSDTDSAFYPLDSKVHVLKMGLDKYKGKFTSIRRAVAKYCYLRDYFRREHPDAVVTFLFNMEAPTILAGLKTNIPVFASVRNSAFQYPKYQRLFRKVFYPHIAGVVFQSQRVHDHPDYKKINNYRVIMNPLATEVKENIAPVPYSERNNSIINIGRLNRQKNQDLLIRSFSKVVKAHPELNLCIFGEGNLRNDLQELINSLGLQDKVTLCGSVPNAAEKNRSARLFVMSSDYEGFPNALVEAMVNGIPSICTDFDSGVAAELIENGVNGWLVKVNDIDDLTKTILHAINLKENTDVIAQNGSHVFDLLNAERICSQWEKYIFT